MADLKKYERDPADDVRAVKALGYIVQIIQDSASRQIFLSLLEKQKDRVLVLYATNEEQDDSPVTIEGYTPKGHFVRAYGIKEQDAIAAWYSWMCGIDLLKGNE